MITVLKEQISSFHLIRRLSLYELKSNNYNNYLGMFWEILGPGIQIAIYWFVFGYVSDRKSIPGINGTEIPYFYWMLAGIIIWFFVNPSITQGSKSIYSRLKLVSKMNFPMSAIPSYVIVAKLYQHLILVGLVTVAYQFLGYPLTIYFIQLPYFIFATLVFLISLALITSTLATIVRDFQLLIQSFMRILLYLTPILWPLTRLNETLQHLLKLNPLYYLAEGYRAALLGQGWFIFNELYLTLYFWAITLVLLAIGSYLHTRFRRHFIDYL